MEKVQMFHTEGTVLFVFIMRMQKTVLFRFPVPKKVIIFVVSGGWQLLAAVLFGCSRRIKDLKSSLAENTDFFWSKLY